MRMKFGNFAKVVEVNDSEGNIQRTVIIRNTPEALKHFGIKKVPKDLEGSSEDDHPPGIAAQLRKAADINEMSHNLDFFPTSFTSK